MSNQELFHTGLASIPQDPSNEGIMKDEDKESIKEEKPRRKSLSLSKFGKAAMRR